MKKGSNYKEMRGTRQGVLSGNEKYTDGTGGAENELGEGQSMLWSTDSNQRVHIPVQW